MNKLAGTIRFEKEVILALVGSTDDDYVLSLEEFLKKHNHVWSGWNYRILSRDSELLEKQKKKNGYFNLYFHYRKNVGGSGNIEALAKVTDWVTGTNQIDSPEPFYTKKGEVDFWKEESKSPSKAWLRISEIERLEKFITPQELNDCSTNGTLNPSTLQRRFAPVEDIFLLKPKFTREEAFLSKETQLEKEARKRSDEELQKINQQAQKCNSNPVKVELICTRYIRNPDVAEFAKRRANGICQLCKKDAPFKDRDNIPYLEVHHIIWLSKGGKDSIQNAVAICPNCHRKLHSLDLEMDKALLRTSTMFPKSKLKDY